LLQEFRLDHAAQVAGVRDDVHGPVRPDLLQRFHIHMPAGVLVTDDDRHGNLHGLEFGLGDGQFGEAVGAGGRDQQAEAVAGRFPEMVHGGIGLVPAHAAEHDGGDAFGVEHGQFHRDHAAHGIAHDARLGDVQVVHQPHDVLDHVGPVGALGFGLVRASVPAAIQRDDLVVVGELGSDAGDVPVHARTGSEPVDEDHGVAFARGGIVDLDSGGIKILRVTDGSG
jgi:hypothetical protein